MVLVFLDRCRFGLHFKSSISGVDDLKYILEKEEKVKVLTVSHY